MGDLGLGTAFSDITVDALLEALFLVVLASAVIMVVQNL
ncbi:MAG: mechanosensitive ion channel family protein, partial [Marinobacter sp.]|nr:mechanosensitive ion channel family protein [Marinobacter sp.]